MCAVFSSFSSELALETTGSHRITESSKLENTFRIMSNLWLTPTLSTQSHIQAFLGHLQGWWLYHSLGSPFQCSTTPDMKEFLLMSILTLPWHSLRLCPLILSLLLGTRDQPPAGYTLLSGRPREQSGASQEIPTSNRAVFKASWVSQSSSMSSWAQVSLETAIPWLPFPSSFHIWLTVKPYSETIFTLDLIKISVVFYAHCHLSSPFTTLESQALSKFLNPN